MKCAVCFFAVLMMSCSSVGPFVRNVSFDGEGNIMIEKCMIHYNSFCGIISAKECQTYTIKTFNQKNKEEKNEGE